MNQGFIWQGASNGFTERLYFRLRKYKDGRITKNKIKQMNTSHTKYSRYYNTT